MLDSRITIGGYDYEPHHLDAARWNARKLTAAQRELMKLHALGPQAIVAGAYIERSRTELVGNGLLRYDSHGPRPRCSIPTVAGRLVISVLLAQEADDLLKAQEKQTERDQRQAEREAAE